MSVYFAQAGGYTKIGYSCDPIGRSTTITINGTRPDDLPRGAEVDLIGWIPGVHADERRLHARFGPWWVAGEWYRLSRDEMAALIWADPCGVDFKRMSAWAVIVMDRQPELTREDLTAAGVPVLGEMDAAAAISAVMSGVTTERAAS